MKTVIVTGGSRGIGAAIVEELASNNYNIVLNYNNSEQSAKQIQNELKENGINIEIFKADVSKRDEVKELIDFTIKKYNNIDVLINNAGVSETKLFTEVTDNDWERMINNNLYSAFCVTQEVAKNMIHQKDGCIINISSIWGMVGASCESIYSITKAGIDAMTKSLAKELGPSNIRVNSIAPGFINTDMNRKYNEKEIESIKEEIPLEKIGKTVDISKCVNWIIDDEYTTGQIISINGGWVIT